MKERPTIDDAGDAGVQPRHHDKGTHLSITEGMSLGLGSTYADTNTHQDDEGPEDGLAALPRCRPSLRTRRQMEPEDALQISPYVRLVQSVVRSCGGKTTLTEIPYVNQLCGSRVGICERDAREGGARLYAPCEERGDNS